jgi:hypothetical protein
MQLEQEGLTDVERPKLYIAARLPEIDLIDVFERGEVVEPTPVGYSDKEVSCLSWKWRKHSFAKPIS